MRGDLKKYTITDLAKCIQDKELQQLREVDQMILESLPKESIDRWEAIKAELFKNRFRTL